MIAHQKGTTSRAARIALYAGVPAAALALVLAAVFAWGDAKAPRTPSGLRMNHKFKAEQVGLTCDVCHEPNKSNPRLMSFPDHDTCVACHADAIDPESKKKNCEACHTQPDYATHVRKDRVLSPLVKFDHLQHQKAGADCTACHAVPDEDVLAGDEMLPSMDTCVKCHADQKVKGGTDCVSCHVKGLEKLTPRTHTAAWKLSHGAGLTRDQVDSNCRVCHTSEQGNSCTACHHKTQPGFGKTVACTACHAEGFDKIRPADHNAAWTSLHGRGLTQSQIDRKCALCHTAANGNDCQSCHRREAPGNHTIGWSQNLHGTAARTNRQSCAVCHDQSECIACHTTNEPFTHTGSWSSPFDRHCLNCHMEGGGYVSGSMQGNCGVCHNAPDVFAKHTAQHLPTVPAHNVSMDCRLCHGVTNINGPKHPVSRNVANCTVCHLP